MNLTNVTGKTIYDENGKETGYILAPVFADRMKTIKGFVCADPEEEEFFLPFDRQSDDIPIFRKKQRSARTPYSPILRPVYSSKGGYLGTVEELTLQNGEPKYLWVNRERYSADSVAAWGDCILLKSEKRRTMPGTNKEPLDLLGKKLRSDVHKSDGTLLFPKGSTVTKKVLRIAAKENKTVELTARAIYPDQSSDQTE